MKIYIASRFKLSKRVETIATILENQGHEVPVKWWNRVYMIEGEGPVNTQILKERNELLPPDRFYSLPECKYSYESDFQGVKEAEIFLFIADKEPRNYSGANVELGIALSDHKPCYCLGRLPNSVLYYEVKRCRDVWHFLDLIEVMI